MPEKMISGHAGNPIPDKLHYIDLEHGTFCNTSSDGLKQAFASFGTSESTHLCVFFHGLTVASGGS